jgi:uncharacterized delta-60 repeat protein/gliding motility-associated-like protein
MKHLYIFPILLILGLCPPIRAQFSQPGELDTTFNFGKPHSFFSNPNNPLPGQGANFSILTSLPQPDGKVLIGGDFTNYNGMAVNRIARLNIDGSLDATFNPGTGANNSIRSIYLQSDGKILIGGDFTNFNGSAQSGITRLNSDGTLDGIFNTGSGANSAVRSIFIQTDGKVLIGGGFTSYNGTPISRIARINTDGSLDATFNPGIGANDFASTIAIQPDGKIMIGGAFTNYNGTAINRIARVNVDGSLDATFNPGAGANGNVRALYLQPDGKILIVGDFTSYNGTARNYITRLNSDGSLDVTFNPGTGAISLIESLALQPDGKILIGGGFQSYNGTAINYIARLNADGSLDATFNPGTGANSNVRSLYLQLDGKILIGGGFSLFNGTAQTRITRLNANGTVDATFNPDTGANGTAGEVRSLVLQPDGKVIIGGGFISCNGIARRFIARLNGDGTLDATFDPGTGANTTVSAVALQPDGKILVGGGFTDFNGTTINRIARLNANGTLDVTFNPGTGANFPVLSIVLQPDGKILIGGNFSTFNGTARNNIARLNTDGSLDATFNPGTGTNIGGSIQYFGLQSDDKVIIGGSFTSYNGTGRNRIARVNSDGSLDATFNPGTGVNGIVFFLALQPNGKILIGGDFTSYNGTARNDMARLNEDGSLDATFNPVTGPGGVPFPNIRTFAIQASGKVIIGGNFANYNSTARNRIARINADGTLDETFNPSIGANSDVWSLAIQTDENVLIGGGFLSYDNIGRSRVARILGLPVAAIPTITSFTPISGPIGTSVTITGTNFDTAPANNIVYFGATRATVTAATATQLTVTVPIGATYQPITVQVSGLTGYSSKPFVVTFAGGGVIDACSFKPRVNFTTGTTPLAIYMSDLDGDGKSDMVTANQNANTISVFRNTGTSGTIDGGSLAAKVDFSVGVQPYFIVMGDVDGDGKPDLIVPNESSGTVSVLRNTSAVGTLDATSFATKVDFTTGAAPHSVSLQDLDEDGKPEMVIANHNSNTLSVLKNNSAPGIINASSFAAKIDFGTGTNPQSVGIADLDGDGKPDLVVTNGNAGTNTLSVLRNTTSTGTINASSFATKVDFTTGFYPRSLAIGDIDNDGKPDLATANFSGNSISVLRNTSTAGSITAGSFAATVNFTAGSGPHAISISDLDGDGGNDIVVANAGSASVGVFKNQSTPGAFTAASLAARVDFIAGFGPVNLALGDVDGDGKNDITVSNGGANTFSVFRNLLGEISLPTITSFTPSFGSAGTSVTINGTNFSTLFTTTVEFNGVPATITASTATTITVDVPAGATTGLIEVTIGCNTINSSLNFVVCSPPAAPVAIHNSGCSGTSILLGASGGSPGLYLWYSVSTGGTAIPSEVNDSFITPTLTSNTSYWVTITDGPCESPRTEVIATVIPLPTAPGVQPISASCPGSDVTFTATGGTDGQYRWYDGATLIVGEVNSTYTFIGLAATKTFQAAIHDGTCESNKTSLTATVQNCTAPEVASTTAIAFIEGIVTIDLLDLVTDEEDNIDPSRLQITMQPVSGAPATLSGFELQINYAGFPFIGEDQVGIEVCDLTDLCSDQQITIELGGEIIVYNGLSPNNDGLNEFFKIQYIEILPETKSNQLFIYNRWGDEVFSVKDYNNDDRVFNGDANNGSKLPTGTYFYKVVFSSGKKTITGFLELKY